MEKGKPNIVLQFYIELKEIEPKIWRRIQVPSRYNFWDLHVAIQDSMGWLDYHLHAFSIKKSHKKKPLEIGIPSDDFDDVQFLPGWEIDIIEYFNEPGKSAPYLYDFGDSWEHEVLLEGILLKDKNLTYPRCLAGERACPPEDCGSVPGYYEMLDVLKNPKHPEYSEYIDWLKNHAIDYTPYDPDRFIPEEVEFWNPKKRWKMAFEK